jgi:hypothetical protein
MLSAAAYPHPAKQGSPTPRPQHLGKSSLYCEPALTGLYRQPSFNPIVAVGDPHGTSRKFRRKCDLPHIPVRQI